MMQTLTGTPKPILTPIQVGQASVKCLKWGGTSTLQAGMPGKVKV